MTEAGLAPEALTLFLVERYVPAPSEDHVRAEAQRVLAAIVDLRAEGTEVRYLGSTLVPADETCFSLIEAASPQVVQRLGEKALVPYDRVVEAVRIEEQGSP